MLKKIRILLAVIMLGSLLSLFVNLGSNFSRYFFWAVKLQFIPALLSLSWPFLLLWLAITFISGRLYCSVICPLGIMQDVFSYFGTKYRRQPKFIYRSPLTKLRYTILFIYIIALVFGLGVIVSFFAPYATFGRLVVNFVNPTAVWITNLVASGLTEIGYSNIYRSQYFTVDCLNFVISGLWGIIIAIVAFFFGRLYCNSICPVGTALGVISCRALYQIRIDEQKCVKCGLCAHNCKAECIDIGHGNVDNSRCVKCFNCLDTCHKGAITFNCKAAIKKSISNKDERLKPLSLEVKNNE